jgi:hypothetical protein
MMVGQGEGTTTKTRTTFSCLTHENAKPVIKTDNSPSCLEQLFYNLVIRNLRDICSPIIQPPQYVNLYQMCLVSRELRDN